MSSSHVTPLPLLARTLLKPTLLSITRSVVSIQGFSLSAPSLLLGLKLLGPRPGWETGDRGQRRGSGHEARHRPRELSSSSLSLTTLPAFCAAVNGYGQHSGSPHHHPYNQYLSPLISPLGLALISCSASLQPRLPFQRPTPRALARLALSASSCTSSSASPLARPCFSRLASLLCASDSSPPQAYVTATTRRTTPLLPLLVTCAPLSVASGPPVPSPAPLARERLDVQ